MKSSKNLKELREQLQEDIITILSNSNYDYLNQSKKNSNRPTVKDKLTDQLCEIVCQTFFDNYGI